MRKGWLLGGADEETRRRKADALAAKHAAAVQELRGLLDTEEGRVIGQQLAQGAAARNRGACARANGAACALRCRRCQRRQMGTQRSSPSPDTQRRAHGAGSSLLRHARVGRTAMVTASGRQLARRRTAASTRPLPPPLLPPLPPAGGEFGRDGDPAALLTDVVLRRWLAAREWDVAVTWVAAGTPPPGGLACRWAVVAPGVGQRPRDEPIAYRPATARSCWGAPPGSAQAAVRVLPRPRAPAASPRSCRAVRGRPPTRAAAASALPPPTPNPPAPSPPPHRPPHPQRTQPQAAC